MGFGGYNRLLHKTYSHQKCDASAQYGSQMRNGSWNCSQMRKDSIESKLVITVGNAVKENMVA